MEKIKQVSIRLVKERPLLSEEQLISPEKVAMVVGDYIRDLDREALCVINFNSKLQPINFNLVSIGAVDTTIATPREILKSAILSNAANMMVLHNHPSNILEPSKEDIRTTSKLVEICNLVGIPLLDHIIVGPEKGRYFSLRNKKLVKYIQIS
jgi:DNA repair protein RadC